jgi:hypothetical protein
VPIWVERFALTVLAAGFFGLVVLNTLKMDWTQRFGLGIGIIGFSVFLAQTLHLSKTRADTGPSQQAEPRKPDVQQSSQGANSPNINIPDNKGQVIIYPQGTPPTIPVNQTPEWIQCDKIVHELVEEYRAKNDGQKPSVHWINDHLEEKGCHLRFMGNIEDLSKSGTHIELEDSTLHGGKVGLLNEDPSASIKLKKTDVSGSEAAIKNSPKNPPNNPEEKEKPPQNR